MLGNRRGSLGLMFVLLVYAPTAHADSKTQKREELKKEVLVPECSWSSMSAAEYENCKKNQADLKAMTPEERARYLHVTQPPSVTVEGPGGLIRNRIRANHSGKGTQR